jgi:hypothetical protein
MKVKINIPTSLDEIPLKRYQDFLKVQSTSTGRRICSAEND